MTCEACAARRGREYENDRDHLLSELARCRREIERLRAELRERHPMAAGGLVTRPERFNIGER